MLELHSDWAVMVVQEAFDGWSLLCIISLMFDAAAGIHGAGGVDAYLQRPPFFRASLDMIETMDPKHMTQSRHYVDLKYALGAILKPW